jgi:hypothetical protein
MQKRDSGSTFDLSHSSSLPAGISLSKGYPVLATWDRIEKIPCAPLGNGTDVHMPMLASIIQQSRG